MKAFFILSFLWIQFASFAGHPLILAENGAPKAEIVISEKPSVSAQTAALENGPFGIRVNSVCPGPTLGTVLMDNNIASGEERGKKNAPGSFAPLRKPGQTEDVANAVLWLLSDKAGHVTGLAVPVDGGIHAM